MDVLCCCERKTRQLLFQFANLDVAFLEFVGIQRAHHESASFSEGVFKPSSTSETSDSSWAAEKHTSQRETGCEPTWRTKCSASSSVQYSAEPAGGDFESVWRETNKALIARISQNIHTDSHKYLKIQFVIGAFGKRAMLRYDASRGKCLFRRFCTESEKQTVLGDFTNPRML